MSALARPAWLAFATFAALIAAAVLTRWVGALSLGGPILYGEGAVAHAALLARDGAEYVPFVPPVFVAANYTPLYFHVVSLGDPFVWGRVVSMVCALFVAGAVAWRARPAGLVVSAGLGFATLALVPIALWGPALKPDLLAVALTVAAVIALAPPGRPQRQVAIAGVLMALAISAKPTAVMPALALGAWLLLVGRPRSLATFSTAGLVMGALVVIATPGGLPALVRHVVDHNALSWSLERALLLGLIGVVLIAAPIAFAVGSRRMAAAFVGADGSGAPLAYLGGSAAIVLLGGREGATINYLVDLSAAGMLAFATVAPVFTRHAAVPALLAAQLVVGLVLLDPLGMSARQGSGAWLAPERIVAARALPAGPILAEDSGLLVMQGREPIVDDLFLWSRLVERGAIDPGPLLELVDSGTLVRVVTDHDLERLGKAPAWARERWPGPLVDAVLARYRLAGREGGLFIYAPR